jgi:3',5'-cyclic-AMP phosphodiesterase
MRKIAFLTDVHLDETFPADNKVDAKKNFETVLADIEARGIQEIIFGGDIGNATAHPYFFAALKSFSVKLILGNHDHFEEIIKHKTAPNLKDEFYYTQEDDNYTYIFLDSSLEVISTVQLDWLSTALHTSKNIILFIHHPIIAVDTPVDKTYPLKNRAAVQAALVTSEKAITIFCGHYHLQDESIYKNIKQIITPSLSFQIVKNAEAIKIENSHFAYRIITIEENGIDTELVSFTPKKLIA